MSPPWENEVVLWYLEVLAGSGGVLLAPFVAAVVLLGVAWAEPLPKSVPRVVTALALAVGLAGAVGHASVVDDANFSFRYVENWLAGNGLVFNPGERVEGYTNFLWVALLAAGAALTPFRPHALAIGFGVAAFVLNLLVVARIGARLDGGQRERTWLPLAALVLALHGTFVVFATTGLETMFASLLVDLGLLHLVRGAGPRDAALAGGWFVLAATTRPDHALFWLAGLVTVAAADWRRVGPYLAALVPYGGYLAWKLSYYGSILPNSFHARAADEPHLQQGLVYALLFLLGDHAWVPLALTIAGLLLFRARDDAERAFSRFVAIAIPLWVAYACWVGGDYIYGRFYVEILPLLALGGERLVGRLATAPSAVVRRVPVAAVLGGALVASAWTLPILPDGKVKFGIADEPSLNRVPWRQLVDPDHVLASRARYAFQDLVDNGIEVKAQGNGAFAYRTRLPVVEPCGLFDPSVASRRRLTNARAGHERCLTLGELVDRGVKFTFSGGELRLPGCPMVAGHRVDELCDQGTCVHIVAYDRELMRRIAAVAPTVTFLDFEAWLDEYLDGIGTRSPDEVRRDLAFVQAYYLAHNDDPERRARIEAAAGKGGEKEEPAIEVAKPAEGMTGFRERMRAD